MVVDPPTDPPASSGPTATGPSDTPVVPSQDPTVILETPASIGNSQMDVVPSTVTTKPVRPFHILSSVFTSKFPTIHHVVVEEAIANLNCKDVNGNTVMEFPYEVHTHSPCRV